MKCRPALCCISQSSIENRIISIADSRVWRSISAWLAIEKAVHGGLTTSTVGQSLRISIFTSFWSRVLLRSNLRPVLGSRMAISMDQPPFSPRAVAAGQIRGGGEDFADVIPTWGRVDRLVCLPPPSPPKRDWRGAYLGTCLRNPSWDGSARQRPLFFLKNFCP